MQPASPIFSTQTADFSPTDLGVKLEGWYDALDVDTLTLSSGLVTAWADKSAQANHLNTTGLTAPTYNASDPLMNNNPSIGSATTAGKVGFKLDSFVTYRILYFVIRYKDGLDSVFDTFNAFMTGTEPGASPRILGDSGTANIRLDSDSFNATVQKNNEAESHTVLPMPVCLLKIESSIDRVMAPNFFHNTDVGTRSWIGAVSEIVAVNTTLTTQEESDLKNYLYTHNGITL